MMTRSTWDTSGLARTADARAERSVRRVRAAIAALQQRGAQISLRSICAEANSQDQTSRLTESVIQRNPAAYALYCDARPPQLPRSRIRPAIRAPWLERKTKAVLIAMLVQTGVRIRKLEQIIDNGLGIDPPGK
jgi:hypothetical protein